MARKEDIDSRLSIGEIAQSLRRAPLTDNELTNVVYIAIGIEVWESNENENLELGVAVFDTSVLASMDFPAPDPQTLVNAVFTTCQYAHYRFVEHARHMNYKGNPGRPEHFNFGTSTWIKFANANKVLRRIFNDPTKLYDAAEYKVEITRKDHKVVVVRHGMEDLDHHLSSFGLGVADIPGLIACYDTQTMIDVGAGSLARLMAALCLKPVNLRNAGNEAAYTLHAMIIATVLEGYGHGLVRKCIKAITTEPDPVNTDEKAPVAWGGTTVEGDEVKLAMSAKKTQALKRHAKDMAGYARIRKKLAEIRDVLEAYKRAEAPESTIPAGKRAFSATSDSETQREDDEMGKGAERMKRMRLEEAEQPGVQARPLPQAANKRKFAVQADRFFHNLGRR